MNILKLFGKIGPALSGKGMKKRVYNWTRIYPEKDEHMMHATLAPKMHYNTLHMRNGSRGNGLGLGRQQQHHHQPKK